MYFSQGTRSQSVNKGEYSLDITLNYSKVRKEEGPICLEILDFVKLCSERKGNYWKVRKSNKESTRINRKSKR